jgi:uncharacterized GH25 family protein
MMMKTCRLHLPLAALVLAALPLASASAHRQWIMPSQAVVDDAGKYVTFDAAVSETLFDFDSFPVKLDGLLITGPDGQPVQAENISAGKLRSTFDVKLPKEGTYRAAVLSTSVMASYTLNGEQKRFRGSEAELASGIPKEATDVRISRTEGRVESFVTVGDATDVTPVGKGLEILALTGATDNVVGTPARFRALIDGKPAPDLDITIVPGGGRFRAKLGDATVKTDANGEVTVNWSFAGMMWVGASWPPRPAAPEGQGGPGGGAGGPGQNAGGPGAGGPGSPGGGRPSAPPRRLTYTATYEVAPF